MKETTGEDLNDAFSDLIKKAKHRTNKVEKVDIMIHLIQFSNLPGFESNLSGGYEEVPYDERQNAMDYVGTILNAYNKSTKKPINIVMFEHCMMHLTRIIRVFNMARGNNLQIGLGGSGR